ncbi:WAT1-related protein At5g64700 isoform X1 [Eucalyptus grandis]|uniref:WAT1-related protein n=2 Tax=Eucalyptus TaxID=3932 RepID=A0ABD3J523_EUCGL|nr:WAT1-related protein At5g64700 isoform X1 [Eucalyptus grandis]
MGLKNPYLFNVLISIIQVGMTLLTKAAFNGGMKSFIFVFYRQMAGTIFLLLWVVMFERRSAAPLTLPVFFKIFALAFLGITLGVNLYGIALVYTSSSLVSVIYNCLPVSTFCFAVLLRKEKLNVRKIAGVAKLGGIAICMGGVATLAFFKGPILNPPFALHNAQYEPQRQHHVSTFGSTKWIVGCFLSFFSVSSWGLWYVLQIGVLKTYPSKLHFTSIQCLLSTIQSFLVAIAMERDLSEWKLTWNVTLLAVLYCGIMVTAIAHYLQSWVIASKGPVFLAMSTPLNSTLTTICSMFLLGESINVGSIVGEIMLVGGLYSVLWGQTQEPNLATESSLPVQVENECINAENEEPKNAETCYLAK